MDTRDLLATESPPIGGGEERTKVGMRLFGPIEVEHAGRGVGPRQLGGRKAKQLLEILLLARGRAVPKERLADRLWGERTPRNVLATLETHVSVLRRSLEALGGQARDLVVTEPGAYRFAVERADVDLDRFDVLTDEAARASGRDARRLLGEALALARGEVLEDEPYADWAEELRRTYGARVLHARLDAAEAALADQDPTAALTHAEAAVARDRFAERGYRLAMLAQHALGRRHEALQTFDRLQGILHEIDLEPTAETAELRSAILRGEEHETLLPSRTTAPSFPSDLHKVLVLDPPGDRIVDANRPACEMLSYERDELLATPISAIHPAEMPAFRRFMEQAKAAGVAWTMQLTCRTKTGHFLPTESWAHPLTLGGEHYMLMLLRETSEHRERPRARPA